MAVYIMSDSIIWLKNHEIQVKTYEVGGGGTAKEVAFKDDQGHSNYDYTKTGELLNFELSIY